MGRVMAKTFDVESGEKGSPLQSRLNAFTKGKAISDILDLSVDAANGKVKATLLYEVGDGEVTESDRIYAKVLQDVPVGSDLQTKVNSFTSGKDIEAKAAKVEQNGDTATVVLLYTKKGE